MGQEAEKKGVVPAGTFYFSGERALAFVLAQHVEGEAAQQGEVVGSVVLARALPVLVEQRSANAGGQLTPPRQGTRKGEGSPRRPRGRYAGGGLQPHPRPLGLVP